MWRWEVRLSYWDGQEGHQWVDGQKGHQWVDGQEGHHQWVVCQLIGQSLPHLHIFPETTEVFCGYIHLPYYTEK